MRPEFKAIAWSVLWGITCLNVFAQGDPSVTAAKELFQRYVELDHNFDTAQGELYSPEAVIKNTRLYPGGQNQTLSFSGAEYKRMLRASLPLAKAKNDVNQYSGITFTKEGNGVRIKCTRISPVKQYSSPFEILVAPAGSVWQIVAETSQSKP